MQYEGDHMINKIASLGVVLAMVILSGCSTTVTIRSIKPAPTHLGKSPAVGIIDVDGGRRDLQDALIEQLVGQSRSGGFFLIKNRKGEGITFNFVDDQPQSTGKEIEIADSDIFLKAIIVESDVEKDTESRKVNKKVTGKDGKTRTVKVEKEVKIIKSSALVAFTLNSKNRIYMDEREFEGKVKRDRNGKEPDKNGMKELAVQNAVAMFLKNITPSYVSNKVKLDDSDDAQAGMLKQAKKGNIAVAREQLAEYFAKNPNNAAAAFNLAVMVDASGEYQEALDLYNTALKLGNKPQYEKQKGACMKRLNEQLALEAK